MDCHGRIPTNDIKWNLAHYAGRWETPHQIIHDELNVQQPIMQGLVAFHTLQLVGVGMLPFPDENRRQQPESVLRWYRTVINWINKHVKSDHS